MEEDNQQKEIIMIMMTTTTQGNLNHSRGRVGQEEYSKISSTNRTNVHTKTSSTSGMEEEDSNGTQMGLPRDEMDGSGGIRIKSINLGGRTRHHQNMTVEQGGAVCVD